MNTTDQNLIHYGTIIRLQLAMSALQQLLAATSDECAEDEGQAHRIAEARHDAVEAIQIALGANIDPPKRLMRDWVNLNMMRDAASVLRETCPPTEEG
jgi:hypothetical protein